MNVLENARRHSGGYPVSVRARAVRSLARPARRPGADGGREGEASEPAGQRSRRRSRDRARGRSRPGHPAGAARARVRAVLPRRHAGRRAPWLGPWPGHRPGLHRGERRVAARRVAARPGSHVRVRAAAADAGGIRASTDRRGRAGRPPRALAPVGDREPLAARERAEHRRRERAGVARPGQAAPGCSWSTTSRRSCAR